jgi:hypothetical protein
VNLVDYGILQLRSISIDASWLLEGFCFEYLPESIFYLTIFGGYLYAGDEECFMTKCGSEWQKNLLWFPKLQEVILVYNQDLRPCNNPLKLIPLEKPKYKHGTALAEIGSMAERFISKLAFRTMLRCRSSYSDRRSRPGHYCAKSCPAQHILEGRLPKVKPMVMPFRAGYKPPVPKARKWEEKIAGQNHSYFCETEQEEFSGNSSRRSRKLAPFID